jgi:hypothetical protein
MVKLLDEDHMQGLELNMVQEKEVELLHVRWRNWWIIPRWVRT